MQIKTTVVGSYPAPRWLMCDPSRGALRDPIMVVLKTQELAGIELPGLYMAETAIRQRISQIHDEIAAAPAALRNTVSFPLPFTQPASRPRLAA